MSTFVFAEPEPCPSCGTTLNASTGALGAQPRPGDLSVCMSCAAFLQFDASMRRELLSPEAFDELPADVREQLQFLRNRLRGAVH